jgi:hypothetical protein
MEMMEAGEEERAAKIIDNMLYAATFGVDKAVFEDGNYRVNLQEDGLYTLSIIPYNGYSFLGIVNYCLFSSENTLQINDLRSGNKYFIYVFYKDDLSTNPENFYLKSSTYKLNDNSPLSIHVATVDLTGIEPKIDEEPYARKYTSNIVAHIKDNTNPHGRTLYQDILNVSEKIYVEGYKINIYTYKEIEFTSNKKTYEFEFEKEIEYVSYMNLSFPQSIYFELNGKNLKINTEGKEGSIKIKVEFK